MLNVSNEDLEALPPVKKKYGIEIRSKSTDCFGMLHEQQGRNTRPLFFEVSQRLSCRLCQPINVLISLADGEERRAESER